MGSLDRLWAGWRTAYVESAASDGGEPPGEGSIFTRILASGLPDEETHVVWRGERCFAILNAFPYTNGHVLVMPYREVATLAALTPGEAAELWAAVTDAVTAIEAAYRPDGVNLGANLGRSAGAGVPNHVHVHVLPRWNGDTNFMTAVAEARVMPETLSSSAARLRAAWPRPTPHP
ncbi:MAG: HIT domain-containing protein [Acidimicrobiales bacterium]|nr:HIT domain-containing protein [Acidimicrobiales bacterium]